MNNQFAELTQGLPESLVPRWAFNKLGFGLTSIVLACLGAPDRTAADAAFISIDHPGALATLAVGINAKGDIVGRYVDSAGAFHGYLLSDGGFTPIECPGAAATRPLGVNLSGDIVGHYVFASQGQHDHGFLLHDGVFTTVDFPGAANTLAVGINSSGDIAGYYKEGKKDVWHGFVLHDGTFTTIDFPGANYTEVWRINDAGQVAGRYLGKNGQYHLFRLTGGNFESFDHPDAVATAPGDYSHIGGLNDLGDIANTYASGTPFMNLSNPNTYGNVHGMLLSEGVFKSIDPPDAVETVACDVNNSREVVGVYTDASGRWHGYLRIP